MSPYLHKESGVSGIYCKIIKVGGVIDETKLAIMETR